MSRLKSSLSFFALLMVLGSFARAVDIAVNPSVTYQTIDRWEGDLQMGQGSPYYDLYKDTLMNNVLNEMGITRVRLGIGNAVENTRDFRLEYEQGLITKDQERCLRFSTVNDNADPNTINPNGFIWRSFDHVIDKSVIPLRAKLAATGGKLYVNLTYVAFSNFLLGSACGGMNLTNHHTDPAEYAEFILAAFQHMQTKYGFVPDSVELYLEPDNVSYPIRWDGTQLARTLLATRQRLVAAGFINPAAGANVDFIAPSTTDAANAITYFDQMVAFSSSHQYLSEISYHRYFDKSIPTLQAIASRARTHGKKTSMLEYGGADFRDLHADLKYGMNSSWEQYTLGYGTCSEYALYGCFPSLPSDNGYSYYLIDDAPAPHTNLILTNNAKGLRQYMKYIRPGARRIDATTTLVEVDPLAFVNANGSYVLVVKSEWASNQTLRISGLPAGTYGITYTTVDSAGVSSAQTTLSDVTLSGGSVLQVPPISSGFATIVTVFGKTAGSTSPCDISGDGFTNVSDVQQDVNQAIGIASCTNGDIDRNGVCNVVDVQRVVNAALGSSCVSP